MAEAEEVPAPPPAKVEQEFPLKKYFAAAQKAFALIKKFDFKAFFQGMFTFLSIIAAYFIIELSYQHSKYVEKMTNIKLKDPKTLPFLFLCLSLYLIFWNIIGHFLKKRALAPKPKSDEYEEIQESDQTPPALEPLPNGQLYTHEIIYDSLKNTVYLFLILLAITAYSYFNQSKIQNVPKLLTIEKMNLCGVWFFMGILFDLIGRLLEKVTKVNEFRVLGISIGLLVGVIMLGLANGLNMFIFI